MLIEEERACLTKTKLLKPAVTSVPDRCVRLLSTNLQYPLVDIDPGSYGDVSCVMVGFAVVSCNSQSSLGRTGSSQLDQTYPSDQADSARVH